LKNEFDNQILLYVRFAVQGSNWGSVIVVEQYMKKLIIILFPVILGVASIIFTGLRFSTHNQIMEIISQTKRTVPAEDYHRIVQQRLNERVSGIGEEYHLLSTFFAILATVGALISCSSRWYEGLPCFMSIFRSINLVVGFGSIILSLVII